MLPPHSKRLKPLLMIGDGAGLENWETAYGLGWTPTEFVKKAAGQSHPGHFIDGVHPALASLFDPMEIMLVDALHRCASGYSGHNSSTILE